MFVEVLQKFAAAVDAADADQAAALFSPDGEYHDLIYGVFRGREAIRVMFRDHWFKDGERYIWDMLEPTFDGRTGYVNWLFSYNLKNPERRGRLLMEGASQYLLSSDGLIDRYREWCDGSGALLRAGAPQEAVNNIQFKHDDNVRALANAGRHLSY